MYDLLIRNGAIVDGKGGAEYEGHIAAADGKIVKIVPACKEKEEGKTLKAVSEVDAAGCFVTPGLIDHHVHLFPFARVGIPAEAACFSSGVTTAVDAGSAGCGNYRERRSFLKMTKLGVKAYLNVCRDGLDSLPTPENLDPGQMDEGELRDCFQKFSDELVGLKIRISRSVVREKGLTPLRAAAALAERTEVPLMVHITDPPAPLEEVFSCLKPGDVVTHMYQNTGYSILEKGRVMEAAWRARERGVLFEAADARAHFSFEVSEPSIRAGFWPDFIATDLTKFSMHLRPTSFNLAMQISKYCLLGIPFPEAVKRCSFNPALDLGVSGALGSLEEGKTADIAVFCPVRRENVFGDRPFSDKGGSRRKGSLLYRPVLTVKKGEMVFRDVAF